MAVRESNGDVNTVRPDPDKRGQAVLAAVIDEHFVTGEPVGSKRWRNVCEFLSRKFGTIRSVMSELEELGFLEQPIPQPAACRPTTGIASMLIICSVF